jgi:hypothetical protein
MANDKLRSTILTQLSSVTRDLSLFSDPRPEHRKAKAAFWSYWMGSDQPPPATIDLALAKRYCGDSRIKGWWDLPGFQDWFSNSEEFKQRVEFLVQLALDNAEDLLRDKSASATAKVAVIKLMLEVANKFPNKQKEERYADEKIAEMDKKQLEDFIAKNLRKLPLTPSSSTDTMDPADS